jgi:hypothetical protein
MYVLWKLVRTDRQTIVQTLCDWRLTYVPEDAAHVENMRTSELSVHMFKGVCVYGAVQFRFRLLNTLEPDRRRHDSMITFVIAQQYSSATFYSLHFHSSQEKIRRWCKKCYFLNFFKHPVGLSVKFLKSRRVCNSSIRNARYPFRVRLEEVTSHKLSTPVVRSIPCHLVLPTPPPPPHSLTPACIKCMHEGTVGTPTVCVSTPTLPGSLDGVWSSPDEFTFVCTNCKLHFIGCLNRACSDLWIFCARRRKMLYPAIKWYCHLQILLQTCINLLKPSGNFTYHQV